MPFCNKRDKNRDFSQFEKEIEERNRIEEERNADRNERMSKVVEAGVGILGLMIGHALKAK